MNTGKHYNVPTIIKITDSLGNNIHVNQIVRDSEGKGMFDLRENIKNYLRPGDKIRIEVEVDPSFSSNDYKVTIIYPYITGIEKNSVLIQLKDQHVMTHFPIRCFVKYNKNWHRLGGYDDFVELCYKVLPPI